MNKTIQNKIQNVFARRTKESYDEALDCVYEIKDYCLNAYDYFQNGNMDAGFELMTEMLHEYFGCEMELIELYKYLDCSRAQFHARIVDCLNGIGVCSRGIKKKIAEIICDDVARDVKANYVARHMADCSKWTGNDVSFSVGNVLIKYLSSKKPEADV